MPLVQSEHNSLLYLMTRAIVKIAMTVFFKKIELRNGKVVPETGPVMFVANHPNSIMDALVLGVVTRRKVNYIGHAGLFTGKLKGWFLRSTGVIPVYRRGEAPEQMQGNADMFEACYRALESGETIGIFPEGISDMLRKVKKIKTGAARIVLEAERRNNYMLGIKVLPVGLHFFSRSRFRATVLVNVGRPIYLNPFFELNRSDNTKAVEALTSRIQRSLENVTINIEHEELDRFVSNIERLFREELKAKAVGTAGASGETIKDFFLTKKIADCVAHYYEHEPARFNKIREQISGYQRKLSRLQLKDAMLKERVSSSHLVRTALTGLAKTILGLPVAVYGVANNFVPYALTQHIARKFVVERTKILSALLIGGGITFPLFYSVQLMGVWFFWGSLVALPYFLTLPATGLFALAYPDGIDREQERLALTYFLFTNRHLYNKMRRERRRVIAELNVIREEYTAILTNRGVSMVDSTEAAGSKRQGSDSQGGEA